MLRDRNIFDILTERNVSWRYFESPPDVSMLRTFARYIFDDQNIRPMEQFFSAARAGTLPSVTFLDPHFHSSAENDDHPPADMARGQTFVEEIYSALTANPQKWARTLFIITYDEHGGFYDHVVPETADILRRGTEEKRIRYGVRVPAFFVSPWVERGKCYRAPLFDHASILKTILTRFCRPDPPFLSDRVLWANDVGPVLSLAAPRTDRPRFQIVKPAVPAIGAAIGGDFPVATAVAPARIEKIAPRPAEALKDWHDFMGNLALIKGGTK